MNGRLVPSNQFDVYIMREVEVGGTPTFEKQQRVASGNDRATAITLMAAYYAAKQEPQTYDPNLLLATYETSTDTIHGFIAG